jgi:OmpA-OmpF porin, OOP family
MRKLAICLALASTALASPSMARDGQWYVGVDGGAMLVEDLKLDITSVGFPQPTSATLDARTGYDVGGVVGYDFGGFRLESEVSYRKADLKSFSSITPALPQQIPSNVLSPSGTYKTNGDVSALSFMVNGLFDFGDDDGLQGFVGGGVGIARVGIKQIFTAPAWLDDSDTGFAWQALAGIRAPLSKHWDAGLKYRFFNAPNVDLVDKLARKVSTDFRSHSLMGSLVYNFGGEPEAAPMVEEPMAPPAPVYIPPAPPAPMPPAAIRCNTGPYIVFFDWDKSNLLPAATSTLDNAVSQYANCGNARVMLAGHADKSGSDRYNVGLSQRRNAAVRGYLETRGIAGSAIATEAFGESAPLVQTANGVREPQNRRVEVSYGPGSGN